MAALLPDRASAALATAELDLGAPLAVAAAAIAGVEDQRNDDTVVATVIGSTVRVTATAPGAVTLESVTGALSDNTLSASASANAAEASTTLSVSPTTAEDTVALAILQRTTPTGGSTATSTGNRGQILVEGAAPAVDEVTVTGAVSADNNDVIATATGNVAAAKIAVAGGVSLAGTGLAATVALDQTLSALPDSTAGADLLIVAGQQAGAAVTAASSDDTVTVTLQSVGGATATLSDSDIVSLATGNANTANLSVIDGSPDTVGASAALSALGDQSGAVSATTANATIALNTGLDSAGNTTGNTGGSTLSVAANTQGATAHGSDSTQTLSVQANRLAGDATNASLSDGDTVADGIQLLATADLVVASTQIQRATVLADGSGNGIAANVADEDGMVSSATVSVTGNTQSASALGADTANTLSLTGNGVDATGAVAAVQSGQAPVSAVTGASTITLFAGSSVDGSTLTVSRNAQLSTATGARSTNTLALTDTATAITIADHAGGVSIGPNGTLPIVAAGYALANAQRNGDGADVTASTVDSIIRTTIAGDAGASTVSVSDNEVLATASGTETLNTATLAFRNAMINGAASLAVGASRQQQQGDVSSAVTGEAGTGLAILTAIDGSVSDSTIVTENNRLEATSIGNNALGNTVTIEASRIETTAAGGVSIEGAAEFNNLTPLDQTPSDVLLFEITSKPPGGVTYAVDIYYSDLGTTIAQGDPRNPFPFAIIIETDGTMYPSAKVGSGKYQVYATATDTQYGDYTPNDTFVPAALSSPFDLADTYVYEFAGQLRAVLPDVAAAAASGPYIPLYTAGTDADGNLAVSSFQYSANATTRARLTDDADAPTASATIKIGTVTAGSSLSDSTVMADQNTLRAAATTNNAINAETVTVATVMAAPVTLLNAQQASWGAAQAFIAVAGTGTPAVNAGGVVIQWEGPIDGSSLSVSQNATTGAAKTNVADNTIRVSANTLEHSIATDGAMVARSPNLSSQADISFLNWQLSGNDAQSTVFGSFAILQQNDPAVSGSGLAVIGNTQTALALGNGAQNTVTLEASAFASAGSALVSEQTSTGNATAGSDATVFASAAMSGSTLALNGNTNQSVAVANEALNAVTLTAANALPAQTVPTNGILNGGATVSADHVLASDQTVIGFGPGTAASATTTVYNGDTADATGGPIVRSTVAMNGNATLAQAGSNAATNSVALNADQSGATAVLDNTQSNSQPTAATTVVSVSLDQGTTAAITLLDVAIATVEGNSATADATGNSSTSTIAVTGTNVDAGLANTDATLDTSVGANADGAYLLGNTVANSGAVAADSSASGYGIALQTDLVGAANSTVRLSGNSSASSATANTTASALTIGGDGTANLDASAGLVTVQSAGGTVGATGGMAAAAVVSGRAGGAIGSSLSVDGNTSGARASGNVTTAGLTVDAANTTAGAGIAGTVDALAGTVNAGFGLATAQDNAAAIAATNTANTFSLSASGTDVAGVDTARLSLSGNAVNAYGTANIAANTVSLGSADAGTFDASAAVHNRQDNFGAVTVSAAGGFALNADTGAAGSALNASTADLTGNSVLALARGNLASNGLAVAAIAVTAGSGAASYTGSTGTLATTLGLLSDQANAEAIVASGTGIRYTVALNGTSGTGTGAIASTVALNGNAVTSAAYGNIATNALTLASRNDAPDDASAMIAGRQSNAGGVAASVTDGLAGASVNGAATNATVSVSGNRFAANAVGNFTASTMTRH